MDEWKPDAAKMWREKMADFRACGVEHIGILTTRLEDCCEEALNYDLNETTFSLETVPQLPLKNCTCENCGCLLYAKASKPPTEAERTKSAKELKSFGFTIKITVGNKP